MKLYRVRVRLDVGGTVEVEAENESAAKCAAYDKVRRYNDVNDVLENEIEAVTELEGESDEEGNQDEP